MLAKEKYGLRGATMAPLHAHFVPFTAQTRMSGVDIDGTLDPQGRGRRDWSSPTVTTKADATRPARARRGRRADRQGRRHAARRGARDRLLGLVHLKDIVKGGIRERFAELRRMGIRTVMITGDNPLTAAAIAAEAGVDDFLAQATPEAKLKLIREEQAKGKLVAMCGDGTNDAPALAQADVGVAMNTGTMAAREAGNMVDLDSDPTKLIEIVAIGKQLLMTRGALTTFSIANDVAKYFAIIPAMFAPFYPELAALNVMGLATPQSAILSAIIFNALIIVALIPLALRGVRYRPLARRAAAPQPAGLRPGRRHRAVRRHQADRKLILLASLSAGRHRHRPARLPGTGERQPDRAPRRDRRLRADRPAVHLRPLLQPAPVGESGAPIATRKTVAAPTSASSAGTWATAEALSNASGCAPTTGRPARSPPTW